MYTSLSYIALNVLKRALSPHFRRAFTNVPFQTNGKTLNPRIGVVVKNIGSPVLTEAPGNRMKEGELEERKLNWTQGRNKPFKCC